MNIGIDIDDTITCTYETLIPMIAFKYGMSASKLMKQRPSYKMLENILPNYSSFASSNYASMAKMVPLKDGVIDVLNKLKSDGHKIIFITGRNYEEYIDPYNLSLSYLKANHVPFDKLIVNAKDKVKDCLLEGIDLFIDDNTKNCKAVSKSGVPTIQMGTIFTQPSKGLMRLDSWNEIYSKIQEMYS